MLVMLTTYARQAHPLSDPWRDVVERSAGADLDIFVAVFAELARNAAGGSQRSHANFRNQYVEGSKC